MPCCVFVAFLISSALRGLRRIVRPLGGHADAGAQLARPVLVSASGARFVRAR